MADAGPPASVAFPDVIGREVELERLTAFLERVPVGGAAFVLTGDAGAGKTTLWRAGVEAAQDRSFRVLEACPGAAETGMSFAAVTDLLSGVADQALPLLPAPQRRALEVALLLSEAEGSGPEPRAVAVALLTTLRSLSQEGSVLVAVDDAQWVDADSAGVLAYAARRLRDEPVGLLLAQRTGDMGARWLDALPRDRVTPVAVAPLSLGATHRLLHDRLGVVLARPVLRRVHETSAGNALYALELARALDGGASLAPGAPLPMPRTLTDLVRARVSALPARTREALLVAAALPEPRVAQVDAALGGDAATVLRPAVEAEVVAVDGDAIVFEHPVLAAAAYGSTRSTARRGVHRRLAATVDDLEERARHLALAGDGPDDAAAATLERAARQASARGAAAAAAELFQHARRLTPAENGMELLRRTVAAARYRFAAGDMVAARRLFEEAVAGAPEGPARAEALAGLAFLVAFEGDQAHGADLAREALEQSTGDELARAGAARVLSAALLFMREDLRTALSYASLAVACARRRGDAATAASCLGSQGAIEALLGLPMARATCEAAVALAPATADDRIVSTPRWNLAVALAWTDELEQAEALGTACLTAAVAADDDSSLPLVLAQLATVAYETGRWPAARRLADEAHEVALQTEQRPQQAFALAARALVGASLGREAEAREDARRVLELAGDRGMAVARLTAVRAIGVLELSLGRPQAAARLLAPDRQRLLAAGVGEPASIRFVADEVEALVLLGRVDEAESVLGWLERRGDALGRASALATGGRCRGLLLAARGDASKALEAFEHAVEHHRRVPMPFEEARTLLSFGAVQRRAKRKRDARRTLGEALSAFDRLGARPWAERTRAELGSIGGRPPSDGGLTATEQRIATLVAEGRTNREVAAALFISERTVESHLSRVYRKLDVGTRAALARRLTP